MLARSVGIWFVFLSWVLPSTSERGQAKDVHVLRIYTSEGCLGNSLFSLSEYDA